MRGDFYCKLNDQDKKEKRQLQFQAQDLYEFDLQVSASIWTGIFHMQLPYYSYV